MNDRIQKLIEQATSIVESPKNAYGWGSSYAYFDKEKFAELILIEVTDILSTYRGKMVFEDGAEYNYEHPIIAIRKHFGVEE